MPGTGRREVHVDALAGDGVLLDAQRGHGEAVDDILRVQPQVDLAAGGEHKLRRDEVVRAQRIGRVEAEWIAFRRARSARAACGRMRRPAPG